MSDNTRLHDVFVSVDIRPGVDFRLHAGTVLESCFGTRLKVGETFVQGLWHTEDLPNFFKKLSKSHKALFRVLGSAAQRTEVRQSAKATAKHYAVGNDFFEHMLGSQKLPPVYTSAFWLESVDSLEQAQLDKIHKLCLKLELKKDDRLLDIGGGWGALAYVAAKYYGATVHVLTIVEEQKEYGEKFCEGLPVYFHLLDYRNMTPNDFDCVPFDKVVTVEMIEHVGLPEQHVVFHQKVSEVLKPGGLLVHQVITTLWKVVDQWLNKYVFPEGVLLQLGELTDVAERVGFVHEQDEEMGLHYPKTLLSWRSNLLLHKARLKTFGYREETFRMFDYYLSLCAVLFETKLINLHQVVLRKQ